jgi:sugar/nucleoside kinase (ribokinase family)
MPHCSLLAEQSRDNLLSLTQGACLVQINRHEASLLIGKEWQDNQDISKLAFLGADWVVVTLGCQGSVSMSRSNDVFVQGAYPVDAVDSCGAGDAHLAALIHYFILDGLDFARAAKIASWVASKNVTCKGPWSGIPSREQLLDFIQTNCM